MGGSADGSTVDDPVAVELSLTSVDVGRTGSCSTVATLGVDGGRLRLRALFRRPTRSSVVVGGTAGVAVLTSLAAVSLSVSGPPGK